MGVPARVDVVACEVVVVASTEVVVVGATVVVGKTVDVVVTGGWVVVEAPPVPEPHAATSKPKRASQ